MLSHFPGQSAFFKSGIVTISSLQSPRFHGQTGTGHALSTVSPEGDSSVCGGRQEGQVLGVPSALNHLILVLPHHHDGKLFSEVSYIKKEKRY